MDGPVLILDLEKSIAFTDVDPDDEAEELAKGLTAAEKKVKPWRNKKGQKKIKTAFGDWKKGKMHSGSKKGPVVKDHKQAIAIALSQGREAMKKSTGLDILDLPNEDMTMTDGPALILDLEKAIPSAKAGGSGRVYEQTTFGDRRQPEGTEVGRVTNQTGAKKGGDGRVEGPLNRGNPDNADSAHINAGQEHPSDAKEAGEDGRVWSSEQEYLSDDEEGTMRTFGVIFNKEEGGMWADPTAAASNAMHFHYDPAEKEYHFSATAQDGTPMASIYKRGNGKTYVMMKSLGGEDNHGLLGHSVGVEVSGAAIRNQMKQLHQNSLEYLGKAIDPEGKNDPGIGPKKPVKKP
jgi:hypothetical protein